MKNEQAHGSSQFFWKLWALLWTLGNGGSCSCGGRTWTYVCTLSVSHSTWGLQGRSVWWSLGCGNPSYTWRTRCFQPEEKSNRAAEEDQHPRTRGDVPVTYAAEPLCRDQQATSICRIEHLLSTDEGVGELEEREQHLELTINMAGCLCQHNMLWHGDKCL